MESRRIPQEKITYHPPCASCKCDKPTDVRITHAEINNIAVNRQPVSSLLFPSVIFDRLFRALHRYLEETSAVAR